MWERIKHMFIKEFIQVFRDPRMRAIIFISPVLQLLLFGYAVTMDVRNIATVILDRDNSPPSREIIARFTKSGYFQIVAYVESDGLAQELLDRGEAQMALFLPPDLSKNLKAGKKTPLQIIVDGTDSNTAGIVLQYSTRLIEEYSQQLILEQLTRKRGALPWPGGIALNTRAWFNENLESRNFYVPGVIAILVTLLTLMLTSMAVVREKEIGTIEQIMVTPITPTEFILGKTLPFALISLGEVIIVTGVGVFWFGVSIRGSLWLLFFCTILYLLTALGVGLLISTISRTQQQAMMTTFFFFMPAILLSGLMFPIANMPEVIQWITYLNPMRYFLVIIRGIFLKGVGVAILWPQMVALALLGFITLRIAARRFRKTFS